MTYAEQQKKFQEEQQKREEARRQHENAMKAVSWQRQYQSQHHR